MVSVDVKVLVTERIPQLLERKLEDRKKKDELKNMSLDERAGLDKHAQADGEPVKRKTYFLLTEF
jgi:hypothetical protein